MRCNYFSISHFCYAVCIHYPMNLCRSSLSAGPDSAPSYRVINSSTTMSGRFPWIRLSICCKQETGLGFGKSWPNRLFNTSLCVLTLKNRDVFDTVLYWCTTHAYWPSIHCTSHHSPSLPSLKCTRTSIAVAVFKTSMHKRLTNYKKKKRIITSITQRTKSKPDQFD